MKTKLIILFVLFFIKNLFCAETTVIQQEEPLISLEFNSISLGNALNILSTKSDRRFITDAQLAKKEITLSLKNTTVNEVLNALLDTYDLYYVRQPNTNIYIIKSKTEGMINTISQIFYCNYASASDLKIVLQTKLTRGGNISSDERTNSIIITDMSDNIEKIKALITELDVPTPQVLLEAKIIDLKIESTLKYGVDIYNIYKLNNFWTNPLELERSRVFKDYKMPTESVIPESSYSQGLAPGDLSSGKIRFGIIQDGYTLDGLIEALKKEGDAKVLTNPKLLVINNEEATINIVEEVPYEEKTLSKEGIAVISTQFKEVGIKMRVKPQINRDGTIILHISPEQSFRTGESVGNIPVINTSKASTTLMLKNGETAVIGGLIRESDAQTEFKIPLLGDIPIIGYLFKKISKDKTRTELTIFITANIVTKTH